MRESVRFKKSVDESMASLNLERFNGIADEVDMKLKYIQSILGKMALVYANTSYFKGLDAQIQKRVNDEIDSLVKRAIIIDYLKEGDEMGECNFCDSEKIREVNLLIEDVISLVESHVEETC